MTPDLAIAWFFTFFPITISPGPANILVSSTSAQYGVRRTLPLAWGIFGTFAIQILIIGFGIGEILFRYPSLFTAFKYVGAAYLFYLAWLFFRSSGLKEGESSAVGLREGIMLQLLNFKAFTVPLIMYTQFLDPATATRTEMIVLTIALYLLAFGSLFAWVLGGSALRRFFQSEFGVRWQGKIFGLLLAGVALWVLFR